MLKITTHYNNDSIEPNTFDMSDGEVIYNLVGDDNGSGVSFITISKEDRNGKEITMSFKFDPTEKTNPFVTFPEDEV